LGNESYKGVGVLWFIRWIGETKGMQKYHSLKLKLQNTCPGLGFLGLCCDHNGEKILAPEHRHQNISHPPFTHRGKRAILCLVLYGIPSAWNKP
jgi:hypothetical protein